MNLNWFGCSKCEHDKQKEAEENKRNLEKQRLINLSRIGLLSLYPESIQMSGHLFSLLVDNFDRHSDRINTKPCRKCGKGCRGYHK